MDKTGALKDLNEALKVTRAYTSVEGLKLKEDGRDLGDFVELIQKIDKAISFIKKDDFQNAIATLNHLIANFHIDWGLPNPFGPTVLRLFQGAKAKIS
jgi:hypothetical protein